MIQIPSQPVLGLTYGARWSEGTASGYWVGLASDPGAARVRATERPDLVLVDSIAADDYDAAIRGEVTAAEIVGAVAEEIEPSSTGRRVEVRKDNADPTLVLIDGTSVIGAWPLDPIAAEDYIAASDLCDWDETDPDATSPADYGDRMTGDALAEALRRALA